MEIEETTNEDEPPHPIEGRPKQREKRVEWSETVTEHQKIRRNKTEKVPMLFSAEKLPLAKELSHKRSKRKKKARIRSSPRRSTRNSRHVNSLMSTNSHQNMESLIKLLLSMVAILWSTMPIWGETKVEFLESMLLKPKVEEDHDHEIPDPSEDKTSRKLRYYHFVLDQMESLKDREDMYQEYTWKASKILDSKLRRTKKGHQTYLRVLWKQGNSTWISLKSLRLHDPYACVLFATEKKLVNSPEWEWVKDFIDDTACYTRMLHAMKTTKSFGPKYKFGVQVPRSVKHALDLDKKNGNNLWKEAILKELKQLDDFKVFRSFDDNDNIEEFQKLPYHMVFDVKFDLRRKARLVVGGDHQTGPKDESYSGVVSLTAIRILFLLATMNKLHLWAADIGNAFLNGITRDKLYIIAGPEFGNRQGTRLVLYKSIYGARASCARFHEHLSEKLLQMGFKPSKADPDLWIRDKGTHYEYIGLQPSYVLG